MAAAAAATSSALSNCPKVYRSARASLICASRSRLQTKVPCWSRPPLFTNSSFPVIPKRVQYLAQRGLHDPALLQTLGLGYAPGGNLRRHLTARGYSFDQMREIGLLNPQGRDAFCRRVIFPCHQQDQIVNLYGRSIGRAFPHRLLPRSKGNLFAWESVRSCSPLILVEGLFDLAVLWQAGFRHTTCAIGTHLTSAQMAQLAAPPGREVYIAFDQDAHHAGQQASRRLAQHLQSAGIAARIVSLPHGHDPNSYFCAGATAADFTQCLHQARPL
jgi:DNA primase